MKFSTRVRYGLKMMVVVAQNYEGRSPIQLAEISDKTGLSISYLAQLASNLKNQGLLVGYAGKHGGYILGRAPGDISIADIVEATNGAMNIVDCVKSPQVCEISPNCESRVLYQMVNRAVESVLKSHSLNDLTSQYWIDENNDKEIREKIDAVWEQVSEMQLSGCPSRGKNNFDS